MPPSIIYFEEGFSERDQYWYKKGKSEGLMEGSQALINLHAKIEMLKPNPIPIIIQSKEITSKRNLMSITQEMIDKAFDPKYFDGVCPFTDTGGECVTGCGTIEQCNKCLEKHKEK